MRTAQSSPGTDISLVPFVGKEQFSRLLSRPAERVLFSVTMSGMLRWPTADKQKLKSPHRVKVRASAKITRSLYAHPRCSRAVRCQAFRVRSHVRNTTTYILYAIYCIVGGSAVRCGPHRSLKWRKASRPMRRNLPAKLLTS